MILEIIQKKRLGKELSYQELDYFFNGYLNGDIKDYQMSSLLMAICIQGMTDEEVFSLTKIFIDSGEILDFSNIPGIKVDKHSTGGIGDKTTLVIVPIVASLGIPVVKMSGRGLGYTGGTIDKLESIPGYRIDLSEKEIEKQVKEVGAVITGQTKSLVPMDKIIYALRDVTGTVSSIPLITSSIMSKKIASGADKILIDIKVGKGALLQTKQEANQLKDFMIRIGKMYQREVRCVISDMNTPLGRCIGNSLEVLEAIDVLKGKEKDSPFTELCISLATDMVSMAKNISDEEARKQVLDVLESKEAYHKFLEIVEHQGGNVEKIRVSDKKVYIRSPKNGVIEKIDALSFGKLALSFGAGKMKLEDKIDYTVGVRLHHFVGEKVKKGEILATLYVKKSVSNLKIDDFYIII